MSHATSSNLPAIKQEVVGEAVKVVVAKEAMTVVKEPVAEEEAGEEVEGDEVIPYCFITFTTLLRSPDIMFKK